MKQTVVGCVLRSPEPIFFAIHIADNKFHMDNSLGMHLTAKTPFLMNVPVVKQQEFKIV